ncbi:PE-PPE domain-containing protein [Mycobacterium sp. ACS1612]|uniref:PE-PPE domain-containing protein n=1 Tax=Mycobacterium sp. ACS1612 TaxID=1834117 RepID=UPI0012EA1B65|nr:PE-PPE domain-containing protein [Mycobacterium sp. ACS1612]
MRRLARTTTAAVFALVAVVLMMVTSTMTSIIAATAIAATTALIMGGTGSPLSPDKDTLSDVKKYLGMAVDNYIAPSGVATPPPGESYNAVAVITPEEWAPQHGTLSLDQSIAIGTANLDNCIKGADCDYNPEVGSAAPAADDNFVVFGYSQSATIATLEKRALAAEYPNGGGPNVSFVMIGNGNRPNGGFLARGPVGFTMPMGVIFGGATFNGSTPTNTQYQTVDIAEQYDVWADVPVNPLNLFAVANWYSSYVHYNYANTSLDDSGIIDQGQHGDTHYYMIPQPILPLLSSVQALPVVGNPLADALDAPLRVLVEAGYNRTVSPGQPVPFNPLYMPNPVKLTADFLVAIPTGLDNAFEDTIGIRPFGTVRPGPYGVGGPAVTETDAPVPTTGTDNTPTTETTETAEKTAAKTALNTTDKTTEKTTDKADTLKTTTTESTSERTSAAEPVDAEKPGAAVPETDTDKTSAIDPKPGDTTGGKDATADKPATEKADTATKSPTKDGDVKHRPRHARSGESAKAATGKTDNAKKAGPRHAR